MTIETTAIKAVAQGNGATTVWPFAFLIPADSDLVLTLVDIASGNETVISPVNYTTTGIGNEAGGTVTYPLSGSPLSSATSIVIERRLPLTQETDLLNQGAVYPQAIEDALDYLTMVAQQLQDQIDRAIVFSVADTVEVDLPLASARANKVLAFNSNGDPIAADLITPGTTVSAAMIPVVTAPTTAAALVALGIPGSLLDLLIPAGTVWDYVLTTAPAGFVFPFGQPCTALFPVLRAGLIAAGSPFGTNGVDPLMPDGRSTTFVGKSNMGGVDNGQWAGGTILGAVAGTQSVTLLLAQLPSHQHNVFLKDNQHFHNISPATGGINVIRGDGGGGAFTYAGGGTGALVVTVTATTTSNITVGSVNGVANDNQTATAGSGSSHENRQPSIIVNKIIKAH